MAVAWLLPALELIGPHLGTILKTATPAFTSKSAAKNLSAETLLQQQVAELQSAASRNAANIAALTDQLQNTLKAVAQAAELAQQRLHRVLLIASVACAISAVALVVALFIAF